MNMDCALSVDNICKQYYEHSVLENISLHIDKGQIFGMVGLNGIGKTTLIKIMMGLLRQDKGEVRFFGQSTRGHVSRKQVFYLPEKFVPSPFLKGWEFLSISLSYYGQSYKDSEARECCRKFGLHKDFLYKKINSYSKGMAQKLGLISAFMSNVSLLVLDEPMSGLDPSARIMVKKQIKNHQKNGGTVFFSSHILSDIDEICDQMSIMHNKKIMFTGPPSRLLKECNATDMETAFLHKIGELTT